MKWILRSLLVTALLMPMVGCGGATPAPTSPAAPSPSPASASFLNIDGFTSLSAKGETGQLFAIVTYSDGKEADESNLSRWSLLDPSVATINANGMVTAVSDGHTDVTATFRNVTATRTILVDLPVDPPGN